MARGDYKSGVENALKAFDKKHLKLLSGPKRRNGKPEKDLTELPCLSWMREQGWSVNIFESKATFNPKSGKWLQQSMLKGTVDCIGTDSLGHAVFIEFKAPGKLSTLRVHQQQFIIEKINAGAFAVAVDELDLLKNFYWKWRVKKTHSLEDAKAFLHSQFPTK
jgi:hypothetical protein